MNRKLVQKDNSTVRVLYISKDEHGGYGVDIGYRFVCLARTSISAIGGRCISLRCGIMYVLYCIHSSLSRLCSRAQKVAHLVENSPKGGNFCSRCFSGHSYSLMAALVKQISRSQSRISSRSYTRRRKPRQFQSQIHHRLHVRPRGSRLYHRAVRQAFQIAVISPWQW